MKNKDKKFENSKKVKKSAERNSYIFYGREKRNDDFTGKKLK